MRGVWSWCHMKITEQQQQQKTKLKHLPHSIVSVSSSHLSMKFMISFLFTSESQSIVYTYHIFIIHLSKNIQLVSILRSSECGWGSINRVGCLVLWKYVMEWLQLENTVDLILAFWEFCTLTSMAPIWNPVYSEWGFPFLHIPSEIVVGCFVDLCHCDCYMMKSSLFF